PVVVNLHGSGFVLQTMGDDALFCQRVADGINGIVVDVDYAKAPELPFPHANLDIDAVMSWLQDRDQKDAASKETIPVSKAFEVDGHQTPLRIDTGKVALTGFSSGGNLALTACVRAKQRDELDKIAAVASFYPSTNLSESPWKKPNVKPESGASGGVLPPPLRNFFYSCYVPTDKQTGKDPTYPLRSSSVISPLYANADEFPQSVSIITCSGDSLAREGRQMAEHIVAGHGVVWWEAKGQGHAWDKLTKPGSEPEKLKEEAYELVIGRLRSA
ncbi:alpha/beta-hydrolase, partial [Meira miltonrushii]